MVDAAVDDGGESERAGEVVTPVDPAVLVKLFGEPSIFTRLVSARFALSM